MKKIVSFVMAAVACLLMAMPAQAQLRFGVKGGVNLSKVTFSRDVFKGDNRMGFFIGPTAELTIPIIGLGVDVAALYNQTDSEVKGELGSTTYGVSETLKSFEIPVNLKWTFGLGSTLGVFLAAGPQFGFHIGDRDYADIFNMKKRYNSFNVGGGLKLFRHIQLGVNYNFGLNDMAHFVKEYEGKDVEFKRKTWQFSLAYMF